MISPFIDHQEGELSYGLGPAGYDIRLNNRFAFPLSGGFVILDPRYKAELKVITLAEGEPLLLGPHCWVLAESLETFQMPDNIAGHILLKSSYARLGLILCAAAIEPGWRGRLVLELFNASNHAIRLYPMQGIAQVQFFRLNNPEMTYETKARKRWQDQTGI